MPICHYILFLFLGLFLKLCFSSLVFLASPFLIQKNYSFLYVDFFILLLKVCTNSNNFPVVHLEPLKHRIMPSAVKDTSISYPVYVPFVPFSFLTVLAKAKHCMRRVSMLVSSWF